MLRIDRNKKGRCAIAAEPIPAHMVRIHRSCARYCAAHPSALQTLWTERPLVFQQLLDSVTRCACCTNCLAFVGPLRRQFLGLTAPPCELDLFWSSSVGMSVAAVCEAPLPMLADGDQDEPLVICEACRSAYCSVTCMKSDEAHTLLCPSISSAGAASWARLIAFADEHCETFLLAARCFAVSIQRAFTGEADTFHAFTQPTWWDVVPVPAEEDEPAFRASLQADAAAALEIFNEVLCVHPVAEIAAAGAVSLEAWGHMLGCLTQNTLAVVVPNPAAGFLSEVCSLLPHAAAISASSVLEPVLRCIVSSAAVREQLEDMDEAAADASATAAGAPVTFKIMETAFKDACALKGRKLLKASIAAIPPAEGSALFSTLSCFNHSCVPNCKVQFFENNRAVVTALRSIAADEELTISYVDVDLDAVERTEALLEYGFTCDCVRCETEKDAR